MKRSTLLKILGLTIAGTALVLGINRYDKGIPVVPGMGELNPLAQTIPAEIYNWKLAVGEGYIKDKDGKPHLNIFVLDEDGGAYPYEEYVREHVLKEFGRQELAIEYIEEAARNASEHYRGNF